MKVGTVYLVGAGPGDPALLTLRAAELIRSAEVVAHDSLIPAAILDLAPADAVQVPVGRRHGNRFAGYRLHPAVVEQARLGRDVIRLKAGDPLVFGRGGEEAEELHQAGIPFQIVPGISSALGAAAYAGIPLTHRDYASDVVFTTGHDVNGPRPSRTQWKPIAGGSGTVAMFMATEKVRANARRLMEGGRSPQTPAACIACATRSEQRIVVGTLGDLADRMAEVQVPLPALIIVGDVVAVQQHVTWVERCRLLGRRILLGRARPGRSRIAAELRSAGASVGEAPILEAAGLESYENLDGALRKKGDFDAVLFGCASGVEATIARLEAIGRPSFLGEIPIVALDRRAEERLVARGYPPVASLPGATEDALRREAERFRNAQLLLITHDEGRRSLVEDLEALDARVEMVASYRLAYHYPREISDRFDLVVLPSSSAARMLLMKDSRRSLRSLPIVVFGKRTEEEARRYGAERIFRSEKYETVSAAAAILAGGDEPPVTAGSHRVERWVAT